MADHGAPRQIPFDLGHQPGLSRDDLVVTAANREAAALIDAWPDWPAPVVVLAGPAGSGKTHLASAWRERVDALVFQAGQISHGLSELPAGRAVLIDPADEGALDEQGLFHLINSVRSGGGHLLLTARRFAPAWGVKLPDLASRLKAAGTVEIREPDDELLGAVVTKLFADRQVEVEPSVVQFMVRRMERSLSTAMSVVERLDRTALEGKTRITRALATQIMTAMDTGQKTLDI